MARLAARQRIVSAFVREGATTPDAAIAFVPDDAVARRTFRRLRRHRAIVEVEAGRYWLDPERLDSFRGAVRRRVAAWVAASGIAATVVATATAVSLVE